MRIELLVTLEPAPGTVTIFTTTELTDSVPGVVFRPLGGLDRVGARFGARIVVDGELEDARGVVALHLQALRRMSAQFPDMVIRIQAVPEGGELQLSGGTFGEHEDELAALLGPLVGGQHWRLYVSFRLDFEGHEHLLRLIERAVAPTYEPTVDQSPGALAVGFEIDGERERVAELVELLRFAWRQEGSDVEALVEVEGIEPAVATVRTWREWLALERRYRPAPSRAWTAAAVRDLPELEGVSADGLTWIDDEGQIFEGELPTGLALIGAGRVAITVEAGARSTLYLVERADLAYASRLALPCIAPQIVGVCKGVVWITGLAPQPGPPRCDVFRVELASAEVTMITGELDAPTIDVFVHPVFGEALLATSRGVYRYGLRGLQEVLELTRDEELTGMTCRELVALLIRAPGGARLVLGKQRTVVQLPSAGYAPRFTAPAT